MEGAHLVSFPQPACPPVGFGAELGFWCEECLCPVCAPVPKVWMEQEGSVGSGVLCVTSVRIEKNQPASWR